MVIKQFREDKESNFSRINPYKKRTWTKNVWDGEQNAYFGRSGKAWCQLLAFYIIFWGVLAMLCALCYYVFDLTLSDNEPKWFAHQPTLAVAPCDEKYYKYCNIEIDSEFYVYVRQIKIFLSKYGALPNEKEFGECTNENHYGYWESSPCIFLKVNNLIGYIPRTYQSGDELPKAAPSSLRNFINSLSEKQKANRIWITCQADDDQVDVVFYPNLSSVNANLLQNRKKVIKTATESDGKFYNNDDFGRIVAVKLKNMPTNVVVAMHCYMWAKNIKIVDENTHGAGVVHIKIQIKG